MDFRLPELGEGVYEAEMTRWLVTVGDQVAPSQGLLEVLTDKATMEVPSPFAGVVSELAVEPGQQIKVGDVVLRFDPLEDGAPAEKPKEKPAKPATEAKKPETVTVPATKPATPATAVKAAPAVRQMARKLGIDLATVRGSGPEGRILVEDLPSKKEGPPSKKPAPSNGAVEFGTPGSRIKLQGVRRKIAEHMVQSKRSVPHYSYVDECDVSELVRARVGLRDAFAARGVKLTYLAFVARAVAMALRDVPMVNATYEESTEELVLSDRYDLGIAVATPAGLMVPVLRDALGRSLFELARDLERLGADARSGKLRLEDLKGGSFTITSIGNYGGLFATPIIHQPQVGIMAMGRIVRRPIFDAQERIVPADMVYLSFSFDHRVLDGAVGATFGNAVMKHLQNPLELAVEMPK
jgi:pyruvate dehydrogenase E2 component (dihydrolipoamide acetyltransferase)/2-oxoisovalerate dehydrogenase E2 component (dihydrolipoyl transacylase)